MSANLFDPGKLTFRKSLLCRLAPFADEELQAGLGKGISFNGNSDLSDLLDLWDWGTEEAGRLDGSLTAEELALLREFNKHLTEHYFDKAGFDDGPGWDWLWSASHSPPPIWRETVRLAQRTLAQFADFDMDQWRALGRPAWG